MGGLIHSRRGCPAEYSAFAQTEILSDRELPESRLTIWFFWISTRPGTLFDVSGLPEGSDAHCCALCPSDGVSSNVSIGPEAESIPHQNLLPPNKINAPYKIYPTPSHHPYNAPIPRTGGSPASRAKRARGSRLSVMCGETICRAEAYGTAA